MGLHNNNWVMNEITGNQFDIILPQTLQHTIHDIMVVLSNLSLYVVCYIIAGMK
jgi:hypothetical protein